MKAAVTWTATGRTDLAQGDPLDLISCSRRGICLAALVTRRSRGVLHSKRAASNGGDSLGPRGHGLELFGWVHPEAWGRPCEARGGERLVHMRESEIT